MLMTPSAYDALLAELRLGDRLHWTAADAIEGLRGAIADIEAARVAELAPTAAGRERVWEAIGAMRDLEWCSLAVGGVSNEERAAARAAVDAALDALGRDERVARIEALLNGSDADTPYADIVCRITAILRGER